MKRMLAKLSALLMLCGLGFYGALSADAEQCAPQTGGELATQMVRIVIGSRIDAAQTLQPGQTARCDDGEDARWAFDEARLALAAVPEPLRPPSLVVHVAPRSRASGVQPIEVHALSGNLLLSRAARFDRSVWLHEIAHVTLTRARPTGLVMQRVHRAFEEGVADYFAAVIAGSPKLGRRGNGASSRDLEAQPRLSEAAWVRYFSPAVDSDPHELGEQLARLLWQRAPRSLPLLEDLVSTLAASPVTASDRPRDVFAELVARCPERSRDELRAVLMAWAPRELFT